MSKKMLIDARHPEETRVAILSNGKVEDFDFESAARKALRGNIYLARVTRVEPSLQAAFVEYGGNRHGFLAFSEIHPDYYQIPVADRDVLREADALEAELAAKLAELDGDSGLEPDTALDEEDEADAAPSLEEPANDTDAEEPRPARSRRRRSRRRRRPASADGETQTAGDPTDAVTPAVASDPETEAVEAPGSENTAENTTENAGESVAADSADVKADEPQEEAAASPDSEPEAEAGDDTKDTIGLEDPEPEVSEEPEPPEDSGEDMSAAAVDADAADETDEGEAERDAGPDGDDQSDALTEPDAPPAPQKTEEELEAERIAAERAAEIADLRARYEDARRQREKLLRNYRIQEVVKRRQILLVQVVKEERGNKGAALTTYLSLAGRYGVLMPNNARGGGVSRKITNSNDRKRLRKAIADLDVPAGQGLIIRTAGAKRTKAEIKRDYDYLSRLWDTIRAHTLESIAPCAIYEEANLIKRAIRDLYDKDTTEVIVEGEAGYREAKDFMKMLMPSHAKNVQRYKERVPLFLKYGVEKQLDEMYQPVVHLKSGGYLVIQQTEALISVDVNSGKATKERSVEATALKTNSEAAVEMARQCRLRDLAGLIVIDFIDMDENKNNRTVEKKLRDAMKTDRARIQIGSISSFGLLEMSRQRRRSGIVDGTTRVCPTCDGAGAVRSAEMAALRILRAIEEVAAKDQPASISAAASGDVALYLLNHKRDWLNSVETAYGTSVEITVDADKAGDQFDITKHGKAAPTAAAAAPVEPTTVELDDLTADEKTDPQADVSTGDAEGEKPKRKRRRKRKTKDNEATDPSASSADPSENEGQAAAADAGTDAPDEQPEEASGNEDAQPKKRRRRGRRGGRRTKDEASTAAEVAEPSVQSEPEASTAAQGDPAPDGSAASDDRRSAADASETDTNGASEETPTISNAPSPAIEPVPEDASGEAEITPPAKPKKKRAGWWSKALGKG
ncbi:MAG: Rne/Rng family ribonuclease [Parvularcula sp.]